MERYEFIQKLGEKFKNIETMIFHCFAITAINIMLLVYVLWRI